MLVSLTWNPFPTQDLPNILFVCRWKGYFASFVCWSNNKSTYFSCSGEKSPFSRTAINLEFGSAQLDSLTRASFSTRNGSKGIQTTKQKTLKYCFEKKTNTQERRADNDDDGNEDADDDDDCCKMGAAMERGADDVLLLQPALEAHLGSLRRVQQHPNGIVGCTLQ